MSEVIAVAHEYGLDVAARTGETPDERRHRLVQALLTIDNRPAADDENPAHPGSSSRDPR